MAQPTRKIGKKIVATKKRKSSENKRTNTVRVKRQHPKYGTSKLEERFENEILKKLNVEYEKQFYAKDIKRYFDFALTKLGVLIEIDGDYW